MTPEAWELPGAAIFVDEVLGALREGASVLIRYPEFGPDGCREAIRRGIRREELLVFRQVEEESEGDALALRIASAFGWDHGEPCLKSVEALAESGRLGGYVIWGSAGRGESWTVWRTFLEKFARACRAQPAGACGQFCLVAPGDADLASVVEEPGIRVVAWRDRLSRLDLQLQLGRQCNGAIQAGVARDLRVSLATELAGFDLDFASWLMTESLVSLMAPEALLRTEAKRRGWSGRMSGDGWAIGRFDQFEGRVFEHSASLAAASNLDEISRRVWRAELSIVFPWLEERRIDIVRKLRDVLEPMQSLFGYVERIEDLEIAHVLKQVKQKRRGLEWASKLEHMNQLRRALAHLEPIVPENLVGAGLLDRSALGAQ